MPKGPQGQKRPADTVANAIRIAKILTGEIDEDTGDSDKDAAAQALGKKGGQARSQNMTPERRREISPEGRDSALAAQAHYLIPGKVGSLSVSCFSLAPTI